MTTYSAGSASVQIVPDFSNAQRRIGEWFAKQNDMKVSVIPDLNNVEMAKVRAEVAAQRPEMKVGIDRSHLARQMVEAVDFLTGTSMVGKALAKLFDVKPILLTNLAGAGVAIASSIGSSLTSAIGGAAAMLPSLASAAAIPIGTAVLGSQGVGDAFKALGGTTEADAKKLTAAMKNLAPAAKDFVTQVHALAPAFKDLRLDVQQHLFDGLGDSVSRLGKVMLPMLKQALGPLAGEIGGIGKNLLGALSAPGNVADFSTTINNVAAALHNVGQAVKPVWQAFADLATVGSGFLPQLTKGFGELAQHFADFIRQARDSGALQDFIQHAFDGLKKVWDIVSDLGSILKSVFTSALPAGEALMGVLKIVTGDLAEFFKSAEAQNSLRDFFDGVAAAIGNLTPGLTSLVTALVTSVLPAMSGLAQAIAPVVNTLLIQFADLLRELGPLFYPALASAIQTALGALSPLVTVFADLATTVLPIVIDAIKTLAPLFAELAEGVGEALVRAIGALAPALPPIVEAFSAIAETLVPFALTALNIAVDILPPFVAILQGLAHVLEFISPILPLVVTGFVAMKIIGPLATMFSFLAEKILAAAIASDTMSTSTLGLTRRGLAVGLTNAAGGAEKLSGAAKGAGTALGIVGVAAGVVMMAMADAKATTDEFAAALMKGGQTARDAAKKMADPGIWDQLKWTVGHLFTADAWNFKSIGENMTAEAKKAAHEQFMAMDPLQQAQSKVAYWQEEINYRMDKFGQNSPEYEAAQRRFAYWSGQVANEQSNVAEATKTATQRMDEQADKERARVDAGLAYQQAILGVHSAMEDYNKTMADGNATEDDRVRSSVALQQAILSVADAAKKKAEQDYTGKDAEEQKRLASAAYLQALKDQSAELTGPAKEAMDAYIRDYERVHGASAIAQEDVKKLGLSVDSLPDSHTIVVDAPTADQVRRLQELGYTVKYLPNGKVAIDVDTATAKAEVAAFVAEMSRKSINVTVRGNTVISVGGKGGGGGIPLAEGGVVHAFAGGGFERMSAGIARVVKPNTWRIIGDRVKDDEAYIPINRSVRSQSILATTASRMGFGLVPPGMSSVYSGPGRDSMLQAERDAATLAAGRSVAGGGASSVAGFVNHGTVLTIDPDELGRKARRGTQRALSVAGL